MKRSTWRQERRNRKIGTAASGYGQSNKMVVPTSRYDHYGQATLMEERVRADEIIPISTGLFPLTVLYQKPRPGFTYGCTVADVLHLLTLIPVEDFQLIGLLIFRQPTRKQTILSSAWGRLQYFATLGDFEGPAIYVEAQEIGASIKWSRKLNLEGQKELARLREDGHKITEDKRAFTITMDEETIRNTILYRTIPHEIGHWVHYEREALDEGTALSPDFDEAFDLYCSKPSQELEQFAHRYAEELDAKLRAKGKIPFERLD